MRRQEGYEVPEEDGQGIHIWIKNSDPSCNGFLDAELIFELITDGSAWIPACFSWKAEYSDFSYLSGL